MIELKYPMFDGDKFIKGACLKLEDGIITSISECGIEECAKGFIMPTLVDCHTHLVNNKQVDALLKYGISTTYDVCASKALINDSKMVDIISSLDMAMGMVLNPASFVRNVYEKGGKYIKVLLFNSLSIGKSALKKIVIEAKKYHLKVVVHATTLETYRQCVEANVDIILHVPMKEDLPDELAQEIATKGIKVVPTLIMMKTFSTNSDKYQPSDYERAKAAVKTLYRHHVTLLCGSDANIGSFSPYVSCGDSLHEEFKLLHEVGVSKLDILKGATSLAHEMLDNDNGRIKVGTKANFLVLDDELANDFTNSKMIKEMWIKGKKIK